MPRNNEPLHSFLQQQLQKINFDNKHVPKSLPDWEEFLQKISHTYADMEQESYLLDRAMELSSLEMQALNAKLSDAQQIAHIGYWSRDLIADKAIWSTETFRITGLDPNNAAPNFEQFLNIIHPEDRDKWSTAFNAAAIEKKPFELEFRIHLPNGDVRWCWSKGQPEAQRNLDGSVTLNVVQRVTGIMMDITTRKIAEEHIANALRATQESKEILSYQASHDTLTGLLNRSALLEQITENINAKNPIAVFFMDLDHFKDINDTFGHRAGDQVIKDLAQRLQTLTDATHVLARLGGDEFVVLIVGDIEKSSLESFAEKVLAVGKQAFTINATTVTSSISIGISVLGENCDTIDKLLQYADNAMYHAKNTGGNKFQFYDKDLVLNATKRSRR